MLSGGMGVIVKWTIDGDPTPSGARFPSPVSPIAGAFVTGATIRVGFRGTELYVKICPQSGTGVQLGSTG